MKAFGWILFWGGAIIYGIFKNLADQSKRYNDIEKTKNYDGIAAIGTLLALVSFAFTGCIHW